MCRSHCSPASRRRASIGRCPGLRARPRHGADQVAAEGIRRNVVPAADWARKLIADLPDDLDRRMPWMSCRWRSISPREIQRQHLHTRSTADDFDLERVPPAPARDVRRGGGARARTVARSKELGAHCRRSFASARGRASRECMLRAEPCPLPLIRHAGRPGPGPAGQICSRGDRTFGSDDLGLSRSCPTVLDTRSQAGNVGPRLPGPGGSRARRSSVRLMSDARPDQAARASSRRPAAAPARRSPPPPPTCSST
jgi:hypothetical protein